MKEKEFWVMMDDLESYFIIIDGRFSEREKAEERLEEVCKHSNEKYILVEVLAERN